MGHCQTDLRVSESQGSEYKPQNDGSYYKDTQEMDPQFIETPISLFMRVEDRIEDVVEKEEASRSTSSTEFYCLKPSRAWSCKIPRPVTSKRSGR